MHICLSLGGQISLTHRRGGTPISHTQEGGGDKHFYTGCGGCYDDVDEKMDVSEAKFLVSEGSKLSAETTFVRSP